MTDIIQSSSLLLALLNPFLVIVYLIDPVQKLSHKRFRQVLVGAGTIATAVFCCFAIVGEVIFSNLFRAQFASFQIFGGVIFLLIGIQFVFQGPTAIALLRGDSKNLASSIAMPVLIGPGTISASVLMGRQYPPLIACAAVVCAVAISVGIVILLKGLHDVVRPQREPLVEQYIEVMGRVAALYAGTVAVDMIMQGIRSWLMMMG